MNSILRKLLAVGASAALAVSLAGCAETPESSSSPAPSESAGAEESTPSNTETNSSSSSDAISDEQIAQASAPPQTEMKNKDLDDSWNNGSAQIQLNGSSASSDAAGVTIDGSLVTIGQEGTYVLSGTLDNGRIIVDAADTDDVQLVLNGADITSQDGPGIQVKEADKVILTLNSGTENKVTDGEIYADTSEDAPNAAIYSEQDLSINGEGTLVVSARNNNGISTKDDLKIASGTLHVTAVNHALKGKDSVSILDGTFTLEAGGDGIQSDQDNSVEKGWIVIDGGTFNITAENDAVQAETGITINGGDFTVTTGGGSANGESHQETFGGGMNGFFPGGQDPFQDASGTEGFGGGRPSKGFRGDTADGSVVEDGTKGSNGTDQIEGEQRERPSRDQGSAESISPETSDTVMTAALEETTETQAPEQESGVPEASESAAEVPQNENEAAPDSASPADASDPGASEARGDRSKARGAADAVDDARGGKGTTGNTQQNNSSSTTSDSHKGIKAGGMLVINDGTFNLNCADDTIHTNGSAHLLGGTYTLSTGDDAVHADAELRVNADIQIVESFEGLEALNLYIEGGNIDITSSDDGINASDGSGSFGGFGGRGFEADSTGSTPSIEISGGTINAVCGGDGLDSNGSITVSGGDITVLVNSSGDNGALDYEGSFTVTGGTIIYGGSGTGQGPGNGSTQSYVFAQSSFAAGTEVSVRKDGQVLVSFTPSIDCTALAFSAPGITAGETYEVYAGDTVAVTATAGEGGTGMGGFGGGHGGMRPGSGEMPDGGQRPSRPSDDQVTEGEMPDFSPDGPLPDGETPELPADGQFGGKGGRREKQTADAASAPESSDAQSSETNTSI